jgi:chromosome segregation ATPase
MTVGIDGELKEILGKLASKLEKIDKLESKLEKIDERLMRLEIGQAELKADIRGDIKTLDERVKGFDKRLENLEFILRSSIEGIIITAVGFVAKNFTLFGLGGNP